MTTKVINNKFKKYTIRILLAILIFLLLLIISGFIIIYSNQDAIKKVFIEELNKSLLSEISVKDIEFSVFEKFPNASLSFKEIVAKDATKNLKKDTLLSARSIYLEFNIWDLYYKTYNIKNIEINEAKILLHTDIEGNDNFHFWKKSDNTSTSNFKFALKKIKFNTVEVIYLNNAARQFYDFNFEKITAKGDFSNNIQNIQFNGKYIIKHFQSGEMVYLKNAKSEIDLNAIINSDKNYIEIKKGDLQINDLNFGVNGNVFYNTNNKSLNLVVKGKNIQLHNFIKQLPAEHQKYFENYESKGNFDIILNIKGMYGGSNIPAVIADFSLYNGEIIQKQNNTKITNVIFKGKYSNMSTTDIQQHILNIHEFSGKLDHGIISGNFTLNDFKNPYINCKIYASVKLEEIHKFIKNEKITDLKGNLTVNINFRGKINKEALNINDFINSQTTGNALLNNISFELKNDNRKYLISNGDFQFTNNDVKIISLNGKISGSDFNLKGSFNNVIPFIFLENQKIQVNADLYSQNINLDELIGAKTDLNTQNKLVFSDNYNFNMNLHINQINYKKFKATAVKGNVKFTNPVFNADHISMNSMNGYIAGNLIVDNSQSDIFKISCDANTKNIDIQQLFIAFDNFGQKNLTYTNIKGNLNSNIQFSANFNPFLQIDKKSIWSILDFKIENGGLVNYQPMMKLSRFINEEELKNINFSLLQNQLMIKNETITIPEMEIKSNALNLKISGNHKFNNEINYHINLLLSDLSSKKRKARKLKQQQKQQEFGYEEDDGLGRTKIFVKATGTIDNPIFGLDSKSMKNQLIENFNQEKRNLGKILKEEFKWLKKDSLDAIQEQRFKIQEKGKYVIDWDEENKPKSIKPNDKDTLLPPSGVKIKWEEE